MRSVLLEVLEVLANVMMELRGNGLDEQHYPKTEINREVPKIPDIPDTADT